VNIQNEFYIFLDMTDEKKLKFALPKGSLWDRTLELMKQAGYTISDTSRSYRPTTNDPDLFIKLLRPQEIPEYLTSEIGFDLGISGLDWVKETGANVEEIMDLEIGGVKIVFCIPTFWNTINSFDEFLAEFIKNGKVLRISTEYINTSINFIMKSKVYKEHFGDQKPLVITPWQRWGTNERVQIFLSFGATEAKPPEEVDGIIDNTETGSTITANNLKIVEVVDKSTARLLANKNALKDPWKREKISDIKVLLAGAIIARKKIHLFMNAREENVNEIIAILPALKKPTISKLAGQDAEGWVALNTIIDKSEFLPLIPKLKKLAQGIVVHEVRQVLPMELSKLKEE
jgi:ATP phosphoribosyltransferase